MLTFGRYRTQKRGPLSGALLKEVCQVGFVSPGSIPQIGTVKKEKEHPLPPAGSSGSDLGIPWAEASVAPPLLRPRRR